nr:EOG090X0OE5 [Cyclestheria hislopi]
MSPSVHCCQKLNSTMASVFVRSLLSNKWLELERKDSLSYECILNEYLKWEGIDRSNLQLKVLNGSEEIKPGTVLPWPHSDFYISFAIPLVGGKGGFGSMLRAIGAQIEKTTNREACRDLSGRRLRDINEEKRLKEWVAKQAEREKEREERKKRKLEKLKQEYRHEFHDPEYQRIRSEIPDKVSDAIGEGFKEAKKPQTLKTKRETGDDGPSSKKFALWSGVAEEEIDSDDSSEDGSSTNSKTTENDSNSSTESSNQSGKPSSSVLELPSQVLQAKETEPVNLSTEDTAALETTDGLIADTSKLPATLQKPEEDSNSDVALCKKDETMNISENAEQVESSKKEAPPKRTPSQLNDSDYPPLDLDVTNPEDLEKFGMDHLKDLSRGPKLGPWNFGPITGT